MQKIFFYIIPILLFSSCFDLISRDYWKDDGYYVADNAGFTGIKTLYIEIDNDSGHGRVDYVEAIGSDDNYIIVKSHDSHHEYWILNKKNDDHYLNADEIVEGPFTIAAFNARKEELQISDLEFTEEWLY